MILSAEIGLKILNHAADFLLERAKHETMNHCKNNFDFLRFSVENFERKPSVSV